MEPQLQQPQFVIRVLLFGLPYSGVEQAAEILCSKFGFKVYNIDLANKPPKMSEKRYVREVCFQEYSQVPHGVVLLSQIRPSLIQELKKRNYFNVVYIDSSLKLRYANYLQCSQKQPSHQALLQFMDLEENGHEQEFQKCLEFIKVRLVNSSDLSALEAQIVSKMKSIIRPFRPSWDEYFMKIADIARRRSNCMKTSVGAVIVNNKNRVVSTGYNGTPKGLLSCFKDGCERCNLNEGKQLDQCLCLHAEESAIIEVGIGKTNGCKLYTTYYPCFSCAKAIKQAGIKKIFYAEEYLKEDSGKPFIEKNFAKEDVIQIKLDNLYY